MLTIAHTAEDLFDRYTPPPEKHRLNAYYPLPDYPIPTPVVAPEEVKARDLEPEERPLSRAIIEEWMRRP
jgi:hypothetical protein